jgi:hypothetical protein
MYGATIKIEELYVISIQVLHVAKTLLQMAIFF